MGLKSGFRSLFHIPTVKRAPIRKTVTALQVRAMQMTRSPEVAEAIAEQVSFGGVDGVGLALVGGEVADELKDLRDIGRHCGAEVEQVVRLRGRLSHC